MNKLAILILLILVTSCDTETEKMIKRSQSIIDRVDIPLEDKYDLIKSDYYNLPPNLQVDFGEIFITSNLQAKLIRVLDNGLMILIEGSAQPLFDNSHFTEIEVDMTTLLMFKNRNMLSHNSYSLNKMQENSPFIFINLYTPINNSLGEQLGAEKQENVDFSYLEHETKSLAVRIILKVKNRINDKYEIVLSDIDLTNQWNELVNDEEKRFKFDNDMYINKHNFEKWLKRQ